MIKCVAILENVVHVQKQDIALKIKHVHVVQFKEVKCQVKHVY